MKTPKESYLSNVNYYLMVNYLADTFERCSFTPSESRGIAELACTLYEQRMKTKGGVYNGESKTKEK